MYSGEIDYAPTSHYFEVTFTNRTDVQNGPKRYFEYVQAAMNYAAFLVREGKHVCIFERERHEGDGDKWKAFWWSASLQEEYEVRPKGRGWGLLPYGEGHDDDNTLYPYQPLDPKYERDRPAA